MRFSKVYAFSFTFVIFFVFPSLILADDFSSSSYIVRDPVTNSGNFSTSTTYQLFGTFGETAIATSTSAAYGVNSGFLYFPYVSLPGVTATPGNSQIVLDWTASVGALGWTVSGYTVGEGTVSGGPYSYSSVGNVLTSTRTGLSNGTTYYFVVRVQDTFSNFIATSTQVSATPTGGAGSGGGGGGGGGIIEESRVDFSGFAYPAATVTLLQDSVVVGRVVANSDASFGISARGLGPGTYNFTLFAEDVDGRRSPPLSYTLEVSRNSTTAIGDINFPPTISLDKETVRKGEPVFAEGYARPNWQVIVSGLIGDEGKFAQEATSDSEGRYRSTIETTELDFGVYGVLAKLKTLNDLLRLRPVERFTVGEVTKIKEDKKGCPDFGDLNDDCHVNLFDFSIAAYWWKRELDPRFAVIEEASLNGDRLVDLVDFSIMAYWWTG